ncbi:unnamed protein product [Trichobilharzia szidati]|nr:unnamed protein product [Trichobilharzia szidati]
MNNVSMIFGIFALLIISNSVTGGKQEVKKVPFIVDDSGEMILTIDGVKYSLDSKLVLKVDDGKCWTKIDFTRPTEAELKAKKGTRQVTDFCDKINQPEEEDDSGSEEEKA